MATILVSTLAAHYYPADNDSDGVGARYSVTSGDLRILMDQPTVPISSHDASRR
jgi:hypothetical protein